LRIASDYEVEDGTTGVGLVITTGFTAGCSFFISLGFFIPSASTINPLF
jgi:hypothetical protein